MEEEEDLQTDLFKRFTWTAEETQALVKVWSNRDLQKKLSSTTRNMMLYVTVARELRRQHGICRTAIQCREKIKKLRHTFKKVEAKGLSSPLSRLQECPFYDLLAPVLSEGVSQGADSPPRFEDDSEDLSRTGEDTNWTGLSEKESSTQQRSLQPSTNHEDGATHHQSSAAGEESDHGRMLIFKEDKLVSVLQEDSSQRPLETSTKQTEEGGVANEIRTAAQEDEDVDIKPCLDRLNAAIQRPLPEDVGEGSKTTPGTRVSDHQSAVPSDNLEQPSTARGDLDQASAVPGNLDQPSTVPGNLDQPSNVRGHLDPPSTVRGNLDQPSTARGHPDQPSTGRGGSVDQQSASTFCGRNVSANKRGPSTSSGQQEDNRRKRLKPDRASSLPGFSLGSTNHPTTTTSSLTLKEATSVDAALRSFKEVLECSVKTLNDGANRRLDRLLDLERRRQRNEHKQMMAVLNVVSGVFGVPAGASQQRQRPGEEEEEEEEDGDDDDDSDDDSFA